MRHRGSKTLIEGSDNTSFWRSITGNALPVTVYLLIYTTYTFAYANSLSVSIIRLSYLLFYALTAWYFLKSFSFLKTSKFLKYLSLLLVIFVIYGVSLYLNGTSGWKESREPDSFLYDYIPSLLPVFVFYYFGRRSVINERWFRVFFIIFLLNTIMLYLREQRTLLETSLTGDKDFISNSGYLFASLLPLIAFFDKRRIIQYVLASIILVLTIICFKRGAVLCAGLSFAYFIFTSIKNTKSSKKILIFLFVAVAIYTLSGFVENLMVTNNFFYSRVMDTVEGKSSGRDDIYGFFIDYFFSSENGIHFLFGNGAYGTVKIYGIEAHTDWLEIAIDFGLVGLIIFTLFWVNVYKNIRYAYKHISPGFYTSIVMCFIFFFSRTFFSMSIGDISFVTACVFGCGMGLIDKERKTYSLKKRQYE